MIKIGKIILIIVLITISISGFSQVSFDIKKYNLEKEKILNLIINSPQFDSIYDSKRIVFIENDILPKGIPLKLRKGKMRVRIIKKEKTKINCEYIVLGDYTTAKVNPISARVQLVNQKKNLILNVGLKKENGEWKIINHLIMND